MENGGNKQSAPVAPAPEQNARNTGETSGENVDLKIAAALGKGALSAANLEGGIDTKIVLTKADKTDTDNAINDAVEAKLNERTAETRFGKWAQGALKNNFIIKPLLAAAYRTKAGQAIRDNGGDLNSAFEALGIQNEGRYNNTGRDDDGVRYAERRARMALEDDAFLNKGESIERVEDEGTRAVGDALKDLFFDIKNANGDQAKIEQARAAYDDQIEEMQKAGAFGDNEKQTLGNKILESKIVRYLVGDHSGRKVTQIDALKRAADGVEALAAEDVTTQQFDNYVNNHLSLYNADMKEGTYTKQKVNNIMAAIAAGGVIGGVAYTIIGRDARSGVRGAVKDMTGEALSSTAASAIVGGAAGFAAGAARGLQQARVKASKAEIEAATSGDELLTAEEKIEKEAMAERAATVREALGENGDESGETAAEDGAKKASIAAVFAAVGKFKSKISGEQTYMERIEEIRDRKSAKELYESLEDQQAELQAKKDDLDMKKVILDLSEAGIAKDNNKIDEILNSLSDEMRDKVMDYMGQDRKYVASEVRKEYEDAEKAYSDQEGDLAELIADIRARNEVSADGKFDLISYSKGNVSRERFLLAEKMAEMEKFVDADKVKELTEERAIELTERNKAGKGEMAKFMVKEAVVDAVIGGVIGASAGAIFDKVKGIYAAKVANKVSSATETVGDEAAVETETPVAEQTGEITAEPKFVEDEQGGFKLIVEKDGVEEIVVGEGDEPGIEFDSQTGEISEDSLNLLRERGIEVGEPRVETVEAAGGYAVVSNAEYFKVGGENYVEHANVNSIDFKQGYTTTSIDRTAWVTDGNSNRLVDISDVEVQNEGDLVMQVVPRNESVDVDNLQVMLTPERGMGGTGIVLDVAPDGTVTIPAGSPAASMFVDGTSFEGNSIEVVREAAGGNGYEVLATSAGSNTLAEIGQSAVTSHEEYIYNIGGFDVKAPEEAMVNIDLDDVGVESLRDSGPVNYEYAAATTIGVNGVASGDAVEQITMPQRTGNYSEALDPFLSSEKEGRALNGENLVKNLVQEHAGANADISGADADAMLINAVNSGEISTQQVLNSYLEQMGNSPEQITEMRAMLGGFYMDIDGDGADDLIDTDWEINAAADILKNSADGEGYSAFVNDTYSLIYEKLDGGEIRLVDYTEEPYEYTTLGFIDKANNVIHQFATKKTSCNGVGIELLDKDGKSIYDESVVRRIWKMSDNEKLDHITERLNCCQKTADVSVGEKVEAENTKTESEKTGTEKTGTEKTGTEKTGTEKTGTEKTGTEKTGTEKTGTEKTGTEKTGTEKTGTEKTGTEKTGTEKTGTEKTGTEKTGTEKTGTEKTGTEKTGTEKTGTEKTGTEKTGTEKTGTEKTGTEKTGTEKTGAEKTGTEKTGTEKTGTEKTGTEKTGTELTGKTDYDVTGGRERTDLGDTTQEPGRRDVEGDGSYTTPTGEMRGDGVIEDTAVKDENGNNITGDRGTYIQDNNAGGQVKSDEQVQEAIKRDVQTEYSDQPAGMRDEEIRTNPSGQSDISGQTGITNPVETPPPDLSRVESAGGNVQEESDEDMAARFARFMGQQ